MDVGKSSKLKAVLVVLVMTLAAASAEARKKSAPGAIGFVLLKALQRSAERETMDSVGYSCYRSMSEKDLYSIRYYESTGRMQIFKRLDADYTCAEVSLKSLEKEFSCIGDDLALAIRDHRAAPGEDSLDINLSMENAEEYLERGAVASTKKALSAVGEFFAGPAYADPQTCALKVHMAQIKDF